MTCLVFMLVKPRPTCFDDDAIILSSARERLRRYIDAAVCLWLGPLNVVAGPRVHRALIGSSLVASNRWIERQRGSQSLRAH